MLKNLAKDWWALAGMGAVASGATGPVLLRNNASNWLPLNGTSATPSVLTGTSATLPVANGAANLPVGGNLDWCLVGGVPGKFVVVSDGTKTFSCTMTYKFPGECPECKGKKWVTDPAEDLPMVCPRCKGR